MGPNADTFTLKPGTAAGQTRFDRTSAGAFGLDITTSELLDLRDAGATGPDTFTITGTPEADTAVVVSPDETTGLGIPTRHTGIEQVTIDTAAGDDRVTARAGATAYTVDGGAGIDVLTVDGDGQIVTTSVVTVTGKQPITNLNFEHVGFVNTAPRGYWVLGDNGSVTPFGTATSFGNAAASPLTLPIVGGATTPSGKGYWLVARDGGVFAFGDATLLRLDRRHHPEPAHRRDGRHAHRPRLLVRGRRRRRVQLRRRQVLRLHRRHHAEQADRRAWRPTPTGQGYWLVATDGGIFSFGDAEFFGSTGAITLNQPIVGMAATPSGDGYWFVAADGGDLQLRRRRVLRLHRRIDLNQPIVGMAATPTGEGYWFVAGRRRGLQLRRRHVPRLGRRHHEPGPGGRADRPGPLAVVALAVVGAHLEGQPLHHQFAGCGCAPRWRAPRTAPTYRLYALATEPPKPGLVRVTDDDPAGAAIEVEVYDLDAGRVRHVRRPPCPPRSPSGGSPWPTAPR